MSMVSASAEVISCFSRYTPGSIFAASFVEEKSVTNGAEVLITPSSTRVSAMSEPVSPSPTSTSTSPLPGPSNSAASCSTLMFEVTQR